MIFFENFEPNSGIIPIDSLPQIITEDASVLDILQILQSYSSSLSNSDFFYSFPPISKDALSPTLVLIPGDSGIGYYDEYSSGYGWWDSGGGIDYAGSNYASDGPSPSTTDAPRTAYLNGSTLKTDGSIGYVNIYFSGYTSDGKNGDQLITQKLNDTTSNILAATPNVGFVNVSATTNGVHDTHSDHYSGNAVDINQINGVSVSSQQGKTLALQLEAQALADPHTRYVEGPGGNWVRSTEGGQWQKSANLPTMNNHVHWSTFRK